MAETKARKGARYSLAGVNQLPLLQDRLILNRYLCGLFGLRRAQPSRENGIEGRVLVLEHGETRVFGFGKRG